MSRRLAGVDPSLIRPALAGLVPYEPGKPVEEVQRELGLERVVKLASNEGPYGPFPSAQEAMARAALELNRYPDGGAYRLRKALAERHGVRFEEVTVCAGADAVIGFTVQATLDPGDEIVTGWPSFASYVLDPLKVGAVPVQVPLREERLDLDAMLDAIGPRTKLVFIAAPNNPTGTTSTREELDAYFARVPAHVLTVARPGLLRVHRRPRLPRRDRGVREGRAPRARAADVLEDLRARRVARRLRGRAGGGRDGDREGAARLRRELGRPGGRAREHRRRRRACAAPWREPRGHGPLGDALRAHGLEPAEPAVANFFFVRVGDAAGLNEALLRRGVIVRPLGAFGAPDALRITAGTPDEIAFLAEALSALALAPQN